MAERASSSLVGADQAAVRGRRRSVQRHSAHPFENPTPVTNCLDVAMPLIPVSFIRLFGAMIGSRRHGRVLLVVAGVLFAGGAAATAAQTAHHDVAPIAAAAATEGTDARFGVPPAPCSAPLRQPPPAAPIPAMTVSPASAAEG